MTEKEFERFAEAWPEPMLLVTSHGTIVSANSAAARELAASGESLLERNLTEFLHNSAEDLNRVLKLFGRSRTAVPGSLLWRSVEEGEEEGIPFRVEGALVSPRDERKAALIQLRFRSTDAANRRFQSLNERIANLSQEVHARRLAEEALVENGRHLEFILESTGVGLWRAEYPFGELDWDSRTRKLLYFDEEQTPTIDLFFERIHPDDRELTRQAVEEAISGSRDYAVDHRAVDPETSEVRWLNSAGTATFSRDGTCLSLDGITVDITDRKRVEEELRSLAEQLSDADKRKDVFLATLAHELRNPLAPIRTGLEILKMKSDDEKVIRKIQGIMESQVMQLTVLVNDLLDISRFTRGQIQLRGEEVPLNEVLQNAVEISRPLIEESSHSLVLDLPDPSPEVTVDPLRLSQIVSNLLNNAAKYTPPEGKIGLSARNEEDWILIRVSDNGLGISPQDQENIFDIFHQLPSSPDKTNSGLGVGLTLVKLLVELHRGSVTVSSEGENCGSVFEVRLPTVSDVHEPGIASESEQAG